jgi:hypothetical protein
MGLPANDPRSLKLRRRQARINANDFPLRNRASWKAAIYGRTEDRASGITVRFYRNAFDSRTLRTFACYAKAEQKEVPS